MTHAPTRGAGWPPSGHTGGRTAAIVLVVTVVALVAIIASIFVRSGQLGTQATEPIIPGVPSGNILRLDQARDVEALYESNFNVPSVNGSNAAIKIETAARTNVSCGSPSPYGPDYNCGMSLVRGPIGGPTEDLLWQRPFVGTTTTNVSLLSPGLYWLMVHVDAGTPPAAVLIVSFDITVEAAIVS